MADLDTPRVRRPGGPLNALSVDVEDYFQVSAFEGVVPRSDWGRLELRVERNSRRLLELFARHGVRATHFVLGWVAERCPGLVREIRDAGHELAIHGYDHRRITTQTPAEFRADVRRARAAVEDLAGVEVLGYRAPSFSILEETRWALDILLEEGFRYDSSIFPIAHDRYGIRGAARFPGPIRSSERGVLVEFPISTIRLAGANLPFVGGGYLRQLPFWYVRWGMRRLNRTERRPAVVYVHPWELDPDQPRQPVAALTRIRHYRNLHRTAGRLDRLLREFRFAPLRQVLGL